MITFGILLLLTVDSFAQSPQDALEFYRQGRYAEAIEITTEELAVDARNINAYVVRGWSMLAIRAYQRALENSEVGLTVFRYDNRLIQMAGEALYGLNRNDEALQYLQEYVSLTPNGNLIDEVYATMGNIFLDKSSYNRAEIAFTAATFFAPDRELWWERLGYVREQLRLYSESLRAYEQSLSLNPDFEAASAGRTRVRQLLAEQE